MASELGLPSTAVITTPFQTLARHVTAKKGVPDHSFLVIEHPIWTRDKGWMDTQAEQLIQPILKILGGRN